MQYTKKIVCIIFAHTFLFASCSREGPEGPAGLQGEQGVAGPQGTRGDKGDKGNTGTANVLYSDWMDLNWNLDDGSTGKEMHVDEPKVTRAFIENGGVVLGYLRMQATLDQGTGVYQLPYHVNSVAILEIFPVTDLPSLPLSSKQGVVFHYYSLTGSSLGTDLHDDQDFDYEVRYILIPGGVHLRMTRQVPDYKDYQEVCKYYRIPE